MAGDMSLGIQSSTSHVLDEYIRLVRTPHRHIMSVLMMHLGQIVTGVCSPYAVGIASTCDRKTAKQGKKVRGQCFQMLLMPGCDDANVQDRKLQVACNCIVLSHGF